MGHQRPSCPLHPIPTAVGELPYDTWIQAKPSGAKLVWSSMLNTGAGSSDTIDLGGFSGDHDQSSLTIPLKNIQAASLIDSSGLEI